MISCRTLGPLVMKVDGEDPPVELTWKKQQALLVYMAYAPRQVRSKDHVMGVLWPDAKKPTASLNQARHLLKRWGKVVIAEDGDQLRLTPSTVELDTTRFDQLVRDHRWSEAAAMVEGEFLDGFTVTETSGFEEWLNAERARWRGRCADVLTREAEALLKAGAPERAEGVAAKALQMAPHSDAALRAYVTSLYLLDRPHEAIEAGQLFIKRLAELGTKPEAETLRLLERLKPPESGPGRKEGKPEPRAPLIGRSAQLTELSACWQAALGGEARVAVVLGDPGMGKTRLADEVIERARLDGAVVGIVRAVPGDATDPWIGVRTMLEGGLLRARGVPGAPPAAIAGVAQKSSVWAETFPGKPGGEPLPFLHAVTEVIRAAVTESPVLLVAEDAQDMDHDSWQALVSVLRSLSKTRFMVLVTASDRPPREELNQLRARIGRDFRGVTVTLDPFAHDELVALAHWVLPDYNAEELDRIARRVRVESGGLPLIAYAVFTAVAEGLKLRDVSKPWPEKGRTLDDALPKELPDSLVGAINVNFGRCPSDAKVVLQVLTVLGEPCKADRLGCGSELPTSRLDKALDQLEWQRWLVSDARGYTFVAKIIRDTILEKQVGTAEKQRIEARMIGT